MPQHPRDRSLLRSAAGLLAGLVLLLGSPAEGAGTSDPAACFLRFQNAWIARSQTAVVDCMQPKGKVLFTLFAYPLSGKARLMGPEQAKETLKTYFKKLISVSLEDVTPKKSPKNVRLYEYTYRATGANERTTHLQVKLKQDPKRLWVLDSVNESARPRK